MSTVGSVIRTLADAKAQNFDRSSLEELRSYCAETNLVFKGSQREETLKKILRNHFKMDDELHGYSGEARQVIRPRNQVVPPVNLTSRGIWGGKRHRIRLAKPGGEIGKRDAGIYIIAGGHYGSTDPRGYGIRYDAWQVVPTPIYLRLLEIEKHDATVERVPVTMDGVETFNEEIVFKHSRFYNVEVEDRNGEPGYQHLPASSLEWYRGKKVDWYMGLELRELQAVAKYLGLNTMDYNEKGTKLSVVIPIERLRENVFTHVFGYPDPMTEAELQEQEKEAA